MFIAPTYSCITNLLVTPQTTKHHITSIIDSTFSSFKNSIAK